MSPSFGELPKLCFEVTADGQFTRLYQVIDSRRHDLGVVSEYARPPKFIPHPAGLAFTVNDLWQILRFMESRRAVTAIHPQVSQETETDA